MNQMSFGDAEYSGKKKRTRREQFLAEMEQVVPWGSLLALIEPFYPVAGRGRQAPHGPNRPVSAQAETRVEEWNKEVSHLLPLRI